MRQWLGFILAPLILVTFLAVTPALAQEEDKNAPASKNNTPYILRLPGCDFQIIFPGEPTQARRCDPEQPDICSRIITYTKVIGLEASYNFNVTCNPLDAESYERYSGEVMKATLDAMVGDGNLQDYKTDFAVFDNVKQAIIVGTGNVNDRETIYSAQLWISENSLFTVEAEIIGFAGDDTDKAFAEILASAGPNPDLVPLSSPESQSSMDSQADKNEDESTPPAAEEKPAE